MQHIRQCTRLATTCLTLAALLLTTAAQAQINAVWITDAEGSITDTANWVDGIAGVTNSAIYTSGDTAIVGSGTATIPAGTTWAAALTISSGATVNSTPGTTSFRPLSVDNQGILEHTGTGGFTLQGSSTKNTGIIRNTGAGSFVLPGHIITNTNGSLQVASGTMVPQLATIRGGTLSISNGATLLANSIATGSFTLQNVAVTNNGTATVEITSSAANARTTEHDLTGTTTYYNAGTLNILWGDATAVDDRTVRMGIASTATLLNPGTINISLTNTLNTDYANQVYLQGAAAFTNEGTINITTIADSTGPAELRWTVDMENAGTITVDGPLSSIQMTGQTLTQTAGLLELKNGGGITGSVVLSGGTLKGAGTIVGNVTFGTASAYDWTFADEVGAPLVVDGTLTLPDTMTVNVSGTGDMPDPAILFAANALAGESNLNQWTIDGVPGLTAVIDGNNVLLEPAPPKGTMIFIE